MYYLIRWNVLDGQKVRYAYRSVKDARKELYRVLKSGGPATEGTIKEYRDNDPVHGKDIGKGYRTTFSPDEKGLMFKVTGPNDRIYVRYINLDTNAKTPMVYDLKSDGSLGRRI